MDLLRPEHCDQDTKIKELLRVNKASIKRSDQLHTLLRHIASLVAKTGQGTERNDTFPPGHLSSMETLYDTDQLLLSVRDNWSGRGSHATFMPKEIIPLEIGRTLGYGANGEVVEATCNGVKLALKKIYCRHRNQTVQMKEIEVLKNTKHHHVVKLVGTYTQTPYLGLLIWPVARCDLSMILEVLDMRNPNNPESVQVHGFLEKLAEHHLSVNEYQDIVGQKEERIWSIFGCLTAAIVYLHQNNIRHKDIKPPNILLSRDGLWLTDFGAAKDFTSDLTSTSESRERGTLRYCAPEVFNYHESGRSADIFSLGCVFLETLVVLIHTHSLSQIWQSSVLLKISHTKQILTVSTSG
jgi:serine/threonine protein kinase